MVEVTNLHDCFLINMKKVQPKMYLYTAINVYRSSGDVTPLILDLGTRFERPTSRRQLCSPERAGYPLNRETRGFSIRLDVWIK
jgi:hypothetical protein